MASRKKTAREMPPTVAGDLGHCTHCGFLGKVHGKYIAGDYLLWCPKCLKGSGLAPAKRCSVCHHIKKLDAFYPRSKTDESKGRQSQCADCGITPVVTERKQTKRDGRRAEIPPIKLSSTMAFMAATWPALPDMETKDALE